ncbi:MAG: STAS/SEC14 domain-containing protein [Rubripirellula sp.]
MQFIAPPAPNDRVIAVAMEGQMTADDMKVMLARLQEIVDRGDRALLLIDMQHYEGFEFGVAREKLKNFGLLWKSLERYAIVGASRWMEIWIEICDPLTPQQMKHFSPEKIDDAWNWLLKPQSANEFPSS